MCVGVKWVEIMWGGGGVASRCVVDYTGRFPRQGDFGPIFLVMGHGGASRGIECLIGYDNYFYG